MLEFSQFLVEDRTDGIVKRYEKALRAWLISSHRLEFPRDEKTHDDTWFHKQSWSVVNGISMHDDPSRNKQYTQWLVGQFLFYHRFQEDREAIKADLEIFDRVKQRMPAEQRDINRYKGYHELRAAIQPYIEVKSEREIEREEIARLKKFIKVIYEGPEGRVYTPLNKDAAILLGRGTRWCTAATNSTNYFHTYDAQGPLYVFITKDGKKWQLHFESFQFMNDQDIGISTNIWVETYHNLWQKFTQHVHLSLTILDRLLQRWPTLFLATTVSPDDLPHLAAIAVKEGRWGDVAKLEKKGWKADPQFKRALAARIDPNIGVSYSEGRLNLIRDYITADFIERAIRDGFEETTVSKWNFKTNYWSFLHSLIHANVPTVSKALSRLPQQMIASLFWKSIVDSVNYHDIAKVLQPFVTDETVREIVSSSRYEGDRFTTIETLIQSGVKVPKELTQIPKMPQIVNALDVTFRNVTDEDWRFGFSSYQKALAQHVFTDGIYYMDIPDKAGVIWGLAHFKSMDTYMGEGYYEKFRQKVIHHINLSMIPYRGKKCVVFTKNSNIALIFMVLGIKVSEIKIYADLIGKAYHAVNDDLSGAKGGAILDATGASVSDIGQLQAKIIDNMILS